MPKDGATATCRNCGTDIEFNEDAQEGWVHAETGWSDCQEDGQSTGFHAEPDDSWLPAPEEIGQMWTRENPIYLDLPYGQERGARRV